MTTEFTEEGRLPLRALEASAVASCLVAKDGSFVWVNPALCAFLGRPERELMQCSWQEVTHPDDLEVDIGLAGEVLSGARDSYRLRKRYLRPDGSAVWGDLTVSGVHDDARSFVVFLSQIVDASAEVAAREAERATRQSVSAAFDAELEGRVILQALRDASGAIVDFVYTEANPAACAGLGLVREEIVGHRMLELFPGAEASGRFAEYVRVAETGEPEVWESRPVGSSRMGEDRYLDARIVQVEGGVSYAYRDVTARVEAEQRLAASEAQLRLLTDNSRDVVFMSDPDTTIIYVSPAITRMLGWRPDEIIGHRIDEFTHPDDLSVLAGSGDDIRSGRGGTWLSRVLRRDGGFTWIEASASPLIDDRGQVYGRTSSWRDVTDRVEAEDRLAASEAQLRLLTDNTRDVVVMARPDGVMTFVSPSIKRVLGWQPEDFLGHRLAEFLHPEDLPVLTQASTRVEGGEEVVGIARYRCADGRYAWVESAVTPILDADGHLTARTAIWRDVTDRMENERLLHDSEERYRLLAENASDAVFSAAPDGHFTYVSPSVRHLLGVDPADIVDRTPFDLVHPDGIEEMRLQMSEVAQGRPVTFRTRLRTASGQYRWVGVSVHPVFDESGQLTARVGSWRDAEAEVSAEAAIEAERSRLQADLDSQIEPHITMRAIRDDDAVIVDYIYEDANPAALAYLGMTMEQFRGMHLMTMYPSAAALVMRDMYSRTVETGEPLIENDYAYPNEMYAGDVRLYDLRGAKLGDGISLSWEDVTERASAARRIAASEEQYRLIAENSADIIALMRDGVIEWVSPSVSTEFGTPAEEWIGLPGASLIHPEDLPSFMEVLDAVERGEARIARGRSIAPSGQMHWVEAHARPYIDATGQPNGLIATLRVVDDLVEVEAELERRAKVDFLTGLANRSEILQQITRASARKARTGAEIAILFCDIDHFKTINDDYGHSAGDEVLRTLGERISTAIRADDRAARIGGDEILVVLQGVHSLAEATALAEKIRDVAAQRIGLERGVGVTPTLSIGVTLLRSGETTDDLVARADNAMYLAKKAGRNRVISID